MAHVCILYCVYIGTYTYTKLPRNWNSHYKFWNFKKIFFPKLKNWNFLISHRTGIPNSQTFLKCLRSPRKSCTLGSLEAGDSKQLGAWKPRFWGSPPDRLEPGTLEASALRQLFWRAARDLGLLGSLSADCRDAGELGSQALWAAESPGSSQTLSALSACQVTNRKKPGRLVTETCPASKVP